jgi:C4-dicarboxylate transporter DctQ subunit
MLRFINRLEEWVLSLLLAGMTLLTFVQVILRYVFNTGLLWALEATTYMFAWMVLIGISYGVRAHAHLGVDAAVKLFPAKAQRVLGLLAIAISLAYAAYMFSGSWGYVKKLYAIGVDAQDIPLPRWLLSSVLPVGFALFALRLLQLAYGIIRGRESSSLVADEASELVRDFEGHTRGAAAPRGEESR